MTTKAKCEKFVKENNMELTIECFIKNRWEYWIVVPKEHDPLPDGTTGRSGSDIPNKKVMWGMIWDDLEDIQWWIRYAEIKKRDSIKVEVGSNYIFTTYDQRMFDGEVVKITDEFVTVEWFNIVKDRIDETDVAWTSINGIEEVI